MQQEVSENVDLNIPGLQQQERLWGNSKSLNTGGGVSINVTHCLVRPPRMFQEMGERANLCGQHATNNSKEERVLKKIQE